jgi:MFS family permease
MKSLRRAGAETFRSLHVRNFRLFFGGQLISQIGNWMTMVAMTLLVLRLTGSGVALGLLAAAQFGPVLLIGPWAGLVADRSDKRHLLLIVQSIAMVQSFALAVLAFSDSPPIALIYVVALVGGITVAFDNPARRAFVVEMVPEADVNNAVSLNSALMTSSRVIGPALAGLLVTTVGFGWAFLADGLSYIAVIVCLFLMRTNELRRPPVAVRGKGQVREGLRYARSVPDLFVPLVMMAIIGTLSYNFQVVFPLFMTRDLGGTDSTFTLLFSVVSIGALIGALAVARRKSISIRVVGLTAIGYGAALTLMTFVPSVAFALPAGLLVGLGSIAFLTASTSIVQMRSDPTMRGRVLALQAMVFLGSTPIGGPILGWVCEHFGARYGVAVGALAALGAGAWGMIEARRIQARSQDPAEAAVVGRAMNHDDATESVEDAIAELGYAALPPERSAPAGSATPSASASASTAPPASASTPAADEHEPAAR